jgi:tetratricopeptide (TPR) repeat protein
MQRPLFIRPVIVGLVLASCALVAAPAAAQNRGSIKGRVMAPDGKLVTECEVTIESLSDKGQTPLILKTDQDGIFSSDSIPIGQWMVSARKDKLIGARKDPASVRVGDMTDTGDLRLHVGTPEELKKYTEADRAEVAKKNANAAKHNAAIDAANKARDAGDFDTAIAKYGEVASIDPTCGACFLNIGNIYLEKKNDPAEAEKAYLKAIELNDAAGSTADAKAKAAPYQNLATLYNKQHKFDEASKMSAKANSLLESTEGGGDASSVYAQGVALWNANKFDEAQAQFEKAVKLDPKMAEAHFQLAMCLVNQNKLPDAKTHFQEYLKLAPTGPNAGTAKVMLDNIK